MRPPRIHKDPRVSEGAWSFCPHCGTKIAFSAIKCPKCSAATGRAIKEDVSPKSYGTAVVLCGIFGTAGIHHFYLGNLFHGLFDVGLLAATITFFLLGETTGNGAYVAMAALFLTVDVLHTMVVFYRLITEQEHDGRNRRVAMRRP